MLIFQNPNNLTREETATKLNQLLNGGDPDLYKRMNTLRDWFNKQFPTFDLYLEDVWNENVDGETHFEYLLRSLHTKDETPPLAYDVYLNHQDVKGVWHLDDYQHTVINIDSAEEMLAFMDQHGAEWPRD